MVERALPRRSALVLPPRREFLVPHLTDIPLSRRGLLRAAVGAGTLALAGAVSQREEIAEYLQESLPHNEFITEATPLSLEEIQEQEEYHQENGIDFLEGSAFQQGRNYSFQGVFEGPGTSVVLRFPGVYRTEPKLSIFDIEIDGRVVRKGIVSSPEPRDQGVLLGWMDGDTHEIRIRQVDTREEQLIQPEEFEPSLWYSATADSLRSIVNDYSAFTLPRPGEKVWNDCIVEKHVVPYTFDGNLRFSQSKIALDEENLKNGEHLRAQMEQFGRTYDDDWEERIEIGPDGEITKLYVQKRSHLTKEYSNDDFFFFDHDEYYMDGTHPMVVVYTPNGMVKAADYHHGLPYFADEPRIMSHAQKTLLFDNNIADPYIQEASFDELLRQKKGTEEVKKLRDEFRKRRSYRKKR